MVLQLNGRIYFNVQRVIIEYDKKSFYLHTSFRPGSREWKEERIKRLQFDPKKDIIVLREDNLQVYLPL